MNNSNELLTRENLILIEKVNEFLKGGQVTKRLNLIGKAREKTTIQYGYVQSFEYSPSADTLTLYMVEDFRGNTDYDQISLPREILVCDDQTFEAYLVGITTEIEAKKKQQQEESQKQTLKHKEDLLFKLAAELGRKVI